MNIWHTGSNATPYGVEFHRMSALDTFWDAQSSKVGKRANVRVAAMKCQLPRKYCCR